MSEDPGMWWGLLVLIVVMIVPICWVGYWYSMFHTGLLKDIFGDRYTKSWLGRNYHEIRRQKPKDIWLLCAACELAVVVCWIALWFLLAGY